MSRRTRQCEHQNTFLEAWKGFNDVRESSKQYRIHAVVLVGTPKGDSSSARFHLFPYAQLDAVTKEYLGKRKLSEPDKDKLLVELIRAHGCKEVAFAACAAQLSSAAVVDFLDNSFAVGVHSLTEFEAYLHAVVAAAHYKDDLLSRSDRTFATAIVTVVRDFYGQGVRPAAAEALFTAWNAGDPSNPLLLSKARVLTEKVCRGVDSHLNTFKQQLSGKGLSKASCDCTIRYKEILSLLRIASVDLEECLNSCLSSWRGWADWTPNRTRLHRWMDVPAESPFRCLLELEGPDLRQNGNNCSSEGQALIRRGELSSWLNSKGFNPGVGLITGDSEQLLTSFINDFLDCGVSAIRPISYQFLQALIERDDLDSLPLQSWRAAESLLDAEFIALLVGHKSPTSKDDDAVLIQGLNALLGDVTHSVRRPLIQEVGAGVGLVIADLRVKFTTNFVSGNEWLGYARRLWELRKVVAASGWLHPTLDSSLVDECRGLRSKHTLESLHDLCTAIRKEHRGTKSHLKISVDAYGQSFVADGGKSEDWTTVLPHILHNLWTAVKRQSVRGASVEIASLDALGIEHKLDCIKKLQGAPIANACDLRDCLASLSQGGTLNVVELTRVVASLKESCGYLCWQELLICMMKSHKVGIHEREFTSLGFNAYRQWIAKLHDTCGSKLNHLSSTHAWLSELGGVESLIRALEGLPESRVAMHCLLIAHTPPISDRCMKMMKSLQRQSDGERLALMQELVLTLRANNSGSISRAVLAVSKVDSAGFQQCNKLLTICKESSEIASFRLAVWLRMGTLSTKTETALTSLGQVLDLGLDNDLNPPTTSVGPTGKHYAKQVAGLVERVQQLEQSRTAMKRKDPNGVKSMVEALGLEQPPSGMASLTSDLPNELVRVVEQTSEDTLQLSFPLFSELSAMERLAFGLKGTETLFVHLQLDYSGTIDAFCVHVEEDGVEVSEQFNTYKSTSAPDRPFSRGRPIRLTYVVARNLWRATHQRGETDIKVIYEGIQAVMHGAANRCMVCGENIGALLHRPTICNTTACHQAYLKSDLEMRLQDVRTNGRAVDLLLTSIFAAAAIHNLSLLPVRPSRLDDPAKLSILLNSLPTTSQLAAAQNLQTGLLGCGQRAELLLSWMLNSFRGFVVEATGSYKIPSLRKIHQFLLVDAPPEIEAAFARHNYMQPRHILFHGTSMDRLYPVLAQGLKILSGTPLQKHGAASGPGIYMAREPNTAMGYATTLPHASSNYNAFFSSRADFQNAQVLLGCEHAGADAAGPRSGAVHVITDPTRVIVRYIFIVPPGARMPRAQDIRVPMLNTFNSLRSTAAPRASDDGFASASRCSVMYSRPPRKYKENFWLYPDWH